MSLEMDSKSPSAIRRSMRERRRNLSDHEQETASKLILRKCLEQPEFKLEKKIALYLSNDGELNPLSIIHHCWDKSIQVYLPLLHPFSTGHLIFLEYLPDTLMSVNRFGIPEPVLSCPHICPLAELDVLFAPLVAFDKHGNRLGMGGGFYDRSLAPIAREGLKTKVIGLAHDCQYSESLPVNSWDVSMHKIITPTQAFLF